MSRTIAVLIASALIAFIAPAPANPSAPTIDDDLAILRALQADRCNDPNASVRIITDRPIPLSPDMGMRRPKIEFGIELISRAPPGSFWPMVELCPTVKVVNHLRLERYLQAPGELPKDDAGIEREFGVTSYEKVSFPAYSRDGMSAVVIAEYMCAMCGQGGTYLFIRTRGGGWKLSDSRIDWMS